MDGSTPDQAQGLRGTPSVDTVPPVAVADPLEPYRRWAGVLFTILAVVAIFAAIVALAANPPASDAPVLLAAVALALVPLIAVGVDLGRRAAWAVHAIAPFCYVIIAAGVIRALVALSQGGLMIPLEVLGALLVLTRDHAAVHMPELDSAGRRNVTLAVGALIVANVLPYLG